MEHGKIGEQFVSLTPPPKIFSWLEITLHCCLINNYSNKINIVFVSPIHNTVWPFDEL